MKNDKLRNIASPIAENAIIISISLEDYPKLLPPDVCSTELTTGIPAIDPLARSLEIEAD
jgi:hypothetical protein